MSLHENGNIRLWDYRAAIAGADMKEVLTNTIRIPLAKGSRPTCMIHPSTYINKLAVGTDNGSVSIVNVRTGKLVFDCNVAPGTAVSTLAQSPVVDVVGVGLADGRIIVHNLRADATICKFSHASGGSAGGAGSRITALAFSDGDVLHVPTLVSATEGGSIALWNLQDKVLRHVTPVAHDAAITFLSFLAHQPCLVTAGGDNSLKVWIIDRLEGAPRILKQRAGHVAPPRLLRYYGGTSVTEMGTGADARVCEIASAGADRTLRSFHMALDRQNCELSQGHLTSRAKELGVHPSSLRLPQITAMAVSDRRHNQWSDVVTAHAGESKAFLWSWENKKLDERTLVMPNPRETVTSVCISACGNFAILGGAAGSVVKYSLQGGGRRGTFPKDPTVSNSYAAKGKKRGALYVDGQLDQLADRDTGRGVGTGNMLGVVDSVDTTLALAMGLAPPSRQPASAMVAAAMAKQASGGAGAGAASGADAAAEPERHDTAVYGVATDLLNTTVVTADASGLVLFWDFQTQEPKSSLQLPATVSSIVISRDSGLVAVACDDFVIRVLDIATRRQVRTFTGHTNRITDMCYSPDGRWLVSSSLDRSIRVWDLPMARCLDWMTFARAPVSVAFAPTSEYLVTAHADSLGLFMWANKAHFGSVVVESAPSQAIPMDMPQPDGAKTGAAGTSTSDAAGKHAANGAGAAKHAHDNDDDSDGEADFSLPAAGAAAASSSDAAGRKRARIEDGGPATAAATAGDAAADDEVGVNIDSGAAKRLENIASKPGCRITLSGLPQSSWVNLPKLDLIYERNKPLQPPKKPEQAPFFLPTVGGLNPTFVAPTASSSSGSNNAAAGASAEGAAQMPLPAWNDDEEGDDDGEEEDSDGGWAGPAGAAGAGAAAPSRDVVEVKGRHITSKGGRMARSKLATMLREILESGASSGSAASSSSSSSSASDLDRICAAVSGHLASLSPAQVDVELRSLCLSTEDDDGVSLLSAFLRYLEHELSVGRRFELTQAHLGLLLAVYQQTIAAVPELKEAAAAVRSAQSNDAARLRTMLDRSLCLVSTYLGQ